MCALLPREPCSGIASTIASTMRKQQYKMIEQDTVQMQMF